MAAVLHLTITVKKQTNILQAEKKPRKVKVYQKTSYHQKNFKPRMTAIVEMVRQIDAELDKVMQQFKKLLQIVLFKKVEQYQHIQKVVDQHKQFFQELRQ